MSAIVRLPISDYEERLLGKRLITATPTFSHGGVKVFHCETDPASLASGTSTASPSTPSALQTLPAEIRLHILAKIFEDIKPLDWLTAHHRSTPASVIFTCKQLYHESRQLALKTCTFERKWLVTWFTSSSDSQYQDGVNCNRARVIQELLQGSVDLWFHSSITTL
ncbi:MAG: hypothetical protein Q9185_005008 [Variospora sp. 1 TL-2023]